MGDFSAIDKTKEVFNIIALFFFNLILLFVAILD
jgi:hypothetical protein